MDLLIELVEDPAYRHVLLNHLPVVGLAVAWVVLPKSVGSNEVGTDGDRLERFAMLEPMVTLWMAVALWFGWRLAQDDHRTRDAVGLGVAVGLAAATKLIGPVAAVAIAGFLLLAVGRDRLRPLVLAGVVSGATFGITYLPQEDLFGIDLIKVFACDTGTPSLCDSVIVKIQLENDATVPVIITPRHDIIIVFFLPILHFQK